MKKGETIKVPHRLYGIWIGMRKRCENTKSDAYDRYGGRGVRVCDEWHDWFKFREWALGNGCQDDLTIDRIDVNGNYEPSNCRWITRADQARNRRTNRKITYNGITKTGAEWARELGFKDKHSLLNRLDNGWTIERAFSTPVKESKRVRPGVSLYKGQKWRANICINGERIHLGWFENIEDAIQARENAEIKYFGKILYQNPMNQDSVKPIEEEEPS